MGAITVKHYLASKLPADLRAGLPDDALVSITVEEEERGQRPATLESLKEQLSNIRRSSRNRVSSEQAASRIRELRDEWEE